MLETLHSGIMTTGVAALASPTITATTGAKKVTNPETNEEEWDISGFKVGTAIVASTLTTIAPTIQEMEFKRVVNSVHDEMAIVETTSEEECLTALNELDRIVELSTMFEEEASDTLGEYGDAKKPYTR